MKPDFSAPQHLSERSQAIWGQLVPQRARSIGRLTLMAEALVALDRAEQARAELSRAALTTTTETTKAVHVHPLVKVERECRAQFARIWSDLGFEFDQSIDGVGYKHWLAQQEAEQR